MAFWNRPKETTPSVETSIDYPAAAPEMSAYDVGLKGTAEELSALFARPKYSYIDLLKGADQAFDEGRPGTLRILLANVAERAKKEKDSGFYVILSLCNRNAEQIETALETLPEDGRQAILDLGLTYAAKGKENINDPLESSKNLIKAGADVHAHNELSLVEAAYSKQTDMVKLLYAVGADFKGALLEARLNHNSDTIHRLETYQDYFVEPDTTTLAEIKQCVEELTKQVTKTASPQKDKARTKLQTVAGPRA